MNISITVDLEQQTVSGTVEVPVPLDQLLQALPPAAAAVMGWLPAITLDAFGVDFQGGSEAFGMYATAGTADSSQPSADLFIGSVSISGSIAYVVGVAVDSAINLSSVPLFGSVLSGIGISDLSVSYASAYIPAGALTLPAPAASPQPSFAAGLSLGFTITAAGGSQSLSLTPSSFSSSNTLPFPTTPPPAGGDLPPIQWFPVQKTFGPLVLNRVGAVTTPGTFGLALDAGVVTTVLSVTLDGFTLTMPANNISISGLSVALQGLSISLQTGAISIAGGLVQTNPGEYDGSVQMQIGSYGINAVGSFADVAGAPSLFIFGLAEGQFGGPPAFFVTGIAAGFGYNRSLTLPTPSQVSQFPLVAVAQNPGSLGGGGIQAALAQLSEGGWIAPSLGAYWVAAGIQFTSFEIVQSFALLTVQFGTDLVIALLGTSTVQLPAPQDSSATYAYAEMMLDAVLQPDQGTFSATGLLTPNSYVLDPNCQLTGGFAVDVWFGTSANAGDFVVTLGGYNAVFQPPPWYPTVPRLGFDWKVSSEIVVTGSAYFAVTPSCGMAGGSLSITFTSGPLSAWFTAWADFIVYWSPFFFVASFGVSVGASYDLNLGFTHKTITISLSADLTLWGQPLAGVANVTWWVISFTVNINGGGQPPAQGPVLGDWPTFAGTFLPPAPANTPTTQNSSVCGARAAAGLLQVFQSSSNGSSVSSWLVTSDAFVFATSTLIPSTTAVVGSSPAINGSKLGVYPMATTATTEHSVQVLNGSTQIDLSSWNVTPVTSGAPAALWGDDNKGEAKLGAEVVPALNGVVVGPPPAPALSGPPAFAMDVLQESLESRTLPLPGGSAVNGSTSPSSQNPFTAITTTIMDATVVTMRQTIVTALNDSGATRGLFAGNLPLLAEDVTTVFQSPPMLGAVGTTGPQASPGATRVSEAGQTAARKSSPAAARPPIEYRGLIRRWATPLRVRARSHLLDRFAAGSDRVVANSALESLAGARAAMAIQAGTTLLWDLSPNVRLTIAGDGRLPLRISMFGENDAAVDDVILAAGRRRSLELPSGLTHVALTALDARTKAADGEAFGWYGTSTLLQIAPRAFLGDDGVIVQPQAPLRVHHQRGTRDAGVRMGRELVAANLAQRNDGSHHAWIETRLPAATRGIAVPLIATSRTREQAPLDAIEIRAMRGGRRVSIMPDTMTPDDGGEVPRYSVAPGKEALHVFVRPAPGWRQDGLLGFRSKDVLPHPELRPPRIVTPSDLTTKVVLR